MKIFKTLITTKEDKFVKACNDEMTKVIAKLDKVEKQYAALIKKRDSVHNKVMKYAIKKGVVTDKQLTEEGHGLRIDRKGLHLLDVHPMHKLQQLLNK